MNTQVKGIRSENEVNNKIEFSACFTTMFTNFSYLNFSLVREFSILHRTLTLPFPFCGLYGKVTWGEEKALGRLCGAFAVGNCTMRQHIHFPFQLLHV